MLPTRFINRLANSSVPRLICISQQNYVKSADGGATKETKEKKTAKKTAPTAQKLDNKSYQVPEYYGHNDMTFFDLDVEMLSSRLPQPSSLKKPTT
ncbi:hypothetical protein SNE40_002338 [Patella caerulea]|uniref:NADH dehydrogenase [ubiquinone] flavoprotein 3, mitochondrial n=1 Tax=Patella caerulea TaxID=87958 RepID=A0AAN8K2Q9_PATCE